MTIVHDSPLAVKSALVLRAEKAREMAQIHAAACRARRQGLCCSTCTELDWRASYRARLAGGVA